MKEVVFSVKSPSGQTRISMPQEDVSLARLKEAIAKATGIAPQQQELRCGYPPVLLGEGDAVPKGGPIVVSRVASCKMVRRVVPADNSCLFSCFTYCMLGRSRAIESARQMRDLVVQELRRLGDVYSEVVLGKEPSDYMAWIKGDNAWGGAIELGLLAGLFGVQVGVFDVQSRRMDLYEADKATRRIYFLYDGLHYDPFAAAAADDAPEAADECVFAIDDG